MLAVMKSVLGKRTVSELFPSMASQPAVAVDQKELKSYYSNTLPIEALIRFLTHQDARTYPIDNREFAFVTATPGTEAETSFQRHRWFESASALRAFLAKTVPLRFEVGPVYSLCVRYCSDPNYKPVLRELIFDVDGSDYFRTCECSGTSNVCAVCWELVRCAVEVLHHLLTKRLRFRNLLWVFSGRRGVHCWVMDAMAAPLGAGARSVILAFLNGPGAKNDPEVVRICRKRFQRYTKREPRSSDEALAEMFPRLDAPVTKTMNHLLKAPFCVHPKTKRVCLPFDPKNVDKLSPTSVPCVDVLNSGHVQARRTFQASVKIFERFLEDIGEKK